MEKSNFNIDSFPIPELVTSISDEMNHLLISELTIASQIKRGYFKVIPLAIDSLIERLKEEKKSNLQCENILSKLAIFNIEYEFGCNAACKIPSSNCII